jgi:hypothetical protein
MEYRHRRATVSSQECETATKPVLAATVHDPEARFLPWIAEIGCSLARFAKVFIAATETTDPRTHSALAALDIDVDTVPAGSVGDARRNALGRAVDHSSNAILMCDFDRFLHWAIHFPEELADLPNRINELQPHPWYVSLGRSTRAFATHPRVQQVAESATNDALGIAVGYPIDAVGGACWLSREGAATILARSIELTAATDLEWPALVHWVDPKRVAFLATEGLEFETATFYPREVAAAGGRDAWIAQVYERPEMWAQRLRLAADSVQALARVQGEARRDETPNR